MGMFDTINCEMPLPQYGKSGNFQTKSLENYLHVYRIDEHGQLLKEKYEYECIDEGDPDAESVMDRIPRYGEVSSEWVPTKHNGHVEFYDCWNGENGEEVSGWVEYSAFFVDGLLQGDIIQTKCEQPRYLTEEEKERNAKYKQEVAEFREARKQESMENIKKTHMLIESLSEAQNALYDHLLESLNLHEEAEDWLFDAVFNNTEHSWEKLKDYL